MEKDVNKTIDDAIEKAADNVRVAVDPNKALHYSQSALNLAQAKSVLACIPLKAIESNKRTS